MRQAFARPASPTLDSLRWAFNIIWGAERPLVATLVALAASRALVPAALTLVAKQLVDDASRLVAGQTGDDSRVMMWLLIGFVVSAWDVVGKATNDYAQQRLSDKVLRHVSLLVLAQAERLPYERFEDHAIQDLIERARARVVTGVASVVTDSLTLLTGLLRTASLLAVAVWIEPTTLIVVALLLVPYLSFRWWLAGSRYRLEEMRTSLRRWTRYYLRLSLIHEYLAEIKQLELQGLFRTSIDELMGRINLQNRGQYRLEWLGKVVFSGLMATALFALLARVVGRVLAGDVTLGSIVAFLGAAGGLRASLLDIAGVAGTLREQMFYVSDLRTLLEMEPSPTLPAVTLPSSAPLRFDDVSFTYPGSSRPALKHVSFTVAPGETIAIVGENGAGKSTLVKLIAGLYRPSSGLIRYGEVDLAEVPVSTWFRHVGFAFQHFNRYEATAAENIAYGDWRTMLANGEAVADLAREVGIESMVAAMPEGLDTRLGRHFGSYAPSEGQWQKLAVARALARRDCRVLILDEPSAYLDARSEIALFELFRSMARERTTFLISHRFSTVSMADRILVLHEGSIIESGSHRALLDADGHYASLWRLQNSLHPSMQDYT